MNSPLIRRTLIATHLFLAVAVGGCAPGTDTRGPVAEVSATRLSGSSAHATPAEVDLQQRQAAVSVAFLSRLDELKAADPHPQDPDHHRAYEAVARHMLARSKGRLAQAGVAPVAATAGEADAVRRADVRRVESEYARQALALQREVVRIERELDGDGGVGDTHAEAAAYDIGLLLTLQNPMLAVPLNSGNGKGKGAGGASGVKGSVNPGGGTNGVNPPQVEGTGSTAYDDYMKRKGFSSHPGYTPTAK